MSKIIGHNSCNNTASQKFWQNIFISGKILRALLANLELISREDKLVGIEQSAAKIFGSETNNVLVPINIGA